MIVVTADQTQANMRLYGALFAGAVLCFCLARLLGDRLGYATPVLAIAGSATCGWSWLLARSLFRPADKGRQSWPLALVLAMIAVEAVLYLSDQRTTPLARMAGNVETLVSSTLLSLAMIAPLADMSRNMIRAELRFRAIFALGYAGLLAVAVIGIDGASPGSGIDVWSSTVKTACAMAAMVGAGMAVGYRHLHPLTDPRGRKLCERAADTDGLSERLIATISDEAVYTLPNLRVADVARQLGEAEYKVTQRITGTLGFRNFNHMVNKVRITAAQRKFSDAAFDRLPVLTIALDCGFGSIGPFNRAFKAETGMTPMQFRTRVRERAFAITNDGFPEH